MFLVRRLDFGVLGEKKKESRVKNCFWSAAFLVERFWIWAAFLFAAILGLAIPT
jgi:hypothetical protein